MRIVLLLQRHLDQHTQAVWLAPEFSSYSNDSGREQATDRSWPIVLQNSQSRSDATFQWVLSNPYRDADRRSWSDLRGRP
jgi:hypothetical protein